MFSIAFLMFLLATIISLKIKTIRGHHKATMTGYYYGLMAQLPLRGEMRVESVVVRELFINMGRVISISVLITFSQGLEGSTIPWILLGTSLLQLGLVRLVDKE